MIVMFVIHDFHHNSSVTGAVKYIELIPEERVIC
jgi:hypothetical protein